MNEYNTILEIFFKTCIVYKYSILCVKLKQGQTVHSSRLTDKPGEIPIEKNLKRFSYIANTA